MIKFLRVILKELKELLSMIKDIEEEYQCSADVTNKCKSIIQKVDNKISETISD